jgi:hypothetical protein
VKLLTFADWVEPLFSLSFCLDSLSDFMIILNGKGKTIVGIWIIVNKTALKTLKSNIFVFDLIGFAKALQISIILPLL